MPLVSPGDSPRSAVRSDPESFQITVSASGPRACEIFCAPFRSEVSIPYSLLGLLKVRPAGLQSQMLWGLIFPGQDPQAGESDVGLGPLTLVGEPLN